MERVRFVEHKGKMILVVDCGNCLPAEMQEVIDECGRVVQSQPEKSVLTLTIAGGGRFDLETVNKLKKLTKENEPYVIKAALVGVTNLQHVVLMTVSHFTGREFHLFDDVESAMDFLAASAPVAPTIAGA